jgi:L-lactate dehydrogenase complex protein LldG
VSAREGILARVRANLPGGPYDLPGLPRFALENPGGLIASFSAALARMGGRLIDPTATQDLKQVIRSQFPEARVLCSAVPEIPGNRDLTQVRHPRDLADVDVAVVRAILGVAETGSVLFTERELKVNTVAYLAQHLMVLLGRDAIVPGLQDAYEHTAFRTARYAVFHTGPSATGDIEGVLIHGAQGVRTLTVVLTDR